MGEILPLKFCLIVSHKYDSKGVSFKFSMIIHKDYEPNLKSISIHKNYLKDYHMKSKKDWHLQGLSQGLEFTRIIIPNLRRIIILKD